VERNPLPIPESKTWEIRCFHFRRRVGRAAASTLRVHQYAQTRPIFSIASAAEQTGTTFPTVAGVVAHLGRLGIIREITGKRRHRLFADGGYLDILNEGTEPIRFERWHPDDPDIL
jgi:hypothetical protein